MDGVAAIDPKNLDPDILLSRKDTGRALRKCGFPVADSSLETMAVRGGGPAFMRWGGRRVAYRWGTALAWAEGRLSNPVASTSELRPVPVSVHAAPNAAA
jgi:hypothetical protein